VNLMKLRLVEAKKAKGSKIGEIAITRRIYSIKIYLSGACPLLPGNIAERFHRLLTRDRDFRLMVKKSKKERFLANKF
jgi:hypothetical protein